MRPVASRRGFLRALTTLPLIGGGVSLIGAPSAVAEPVTPALMRAYTAWLAREHGRAHDAYVAMLPPAERFYGGPGSRFEPPIATLADRAISNWPVCSQIGNAERWAPPAARAALVLSAVGVDWRSDPG